MDIQCSKGSLPNTPYMAYSGSMILVQDFRGLAVQITPESLEHIASGHPDVAFSEIEAVLGDPDEVRRSAVITKTRCRSELYHRVKTRQPLRLTTAVVKLCPDGNWLVTAYTADSMKAGESLFKKESRV